MTNDVLLELLDTLLPGDEALPAFSRADIDPARLAAPAGPLLAAIDQAFVRATAADRIERLREIERNVPEAFRVFLGQALAAYYQASRVQAALGWRALPPQPSGHQLSAGDDVAWRLLEKVRMRGQLWRE